MTRRFFLFVLVLVFVGCGRIQRMRPENQRGAIMMTGATVMLAGIPLIVIDGKCYGIDGSPDDGRQCEHVFDTHTTGEAFITIGGTVALVGAAMLLLLTDEDLKAGGHRGN